MANRILNNLFSPSFLVIHVTLAFGTGIILARPEFSLAPALLIITICLGLTCLVALHLAKKQSHFLIIIFFVVLGICRGSYALAPPQASHHIANLVTEEQEVSLIGIISKAPEYGLDKTTLFIKCQEIFIPPPGTLPVLPANLKLPAFQKTTGLVKLSMRSPQAISFLPGDRILARARIGPPQGFNNPGGFNLPLFLASQNIFTNGWISSEQSIIKMDSSSNYEYLFRYGPERLRSHLISFLSIHLPETHSTLYRALITGDRSGLPSELVELFRSLGIVHLLAISGLHMALLAGGVIALSSWLLQKSETILLHGSIRKISACAAILPLFLYCLVAGFQTPALRALLMILVFISALLSDRQWHGPTNISLAALLILIVNPLAITTVSFQLSFAAVTGIIIVLPHTRHLFTDCDHTDLKNKIIRYFAGSFFVSLAASLATLPFLLYHFNRFALSGPLATILIEPFLCMWALGWGLPASVFAPLFPELALLFFKIGGTGLDISLFLVEQLQPLSRSIWLPTPSLAQIVLYYLGLFLFIKTESIRFRAVAILCCLLLFVSIPQRPKNDRATILDVGQGNCTLIETRNGKVLVIDAGGPHAAFDIGRQVLAPAFWAKGIRVIDLLVLSHPDLDHYSGATFLIEHFAPRTLWIPTRDAQEPGWQKMLTIASRQKIAVHIPKAGELFNLGAGRELSCLTDLHNTPQEKQNNQSLVVKFTSANHSLLMPGDIEHEGEKYLVDNQAHLSSDIIIAPHHGSASSSSRQFVTKVAPQTVIFSASRYKKNLFPNQTVQQSYRDIGASTMLTAESGAITIFFEKNGLSLAASK